MSMTIRKTHKTLPFGRIKKKENPTGKHLGEKEDLAGTLSVL